MLKLRSAAGIVLAAIVASVMVAAPSFAAPAAASLTCSAPSGPNRDVTIDLAISGLAADATTPVQVTIMVGSTLALTNTFSATSQWHYVATKAIPSGLRSGAVNVSVTVGNQVDSCSVSWSAFAIGPWSLPSGLAAGKPGSVSATVSSALDLQGFYAVLQYQASNGWVDVATSDFGANGIASFTMAATRWEAVRVLVVAEEDASSQYVWASPSQIFDVKVTKPTLVSKPASVVQTHSGAVVVNYGSYATGGTATLQRKTSAGAWAVVKKVALTHGVATVSWKPTATNTYRVAVKPTGDPASYTPTFTVTYVPLLAVSAPASAKKSAVVTFTLTQHLAPTFSANLQRWSGSKWVTVKTFVVGTTVQKVTATLTGTGKWRVSASGYASAAITVKAT